MEKKLTKVLPICNKNEATLEELVEGCFIFCPLGIVAKSPNVPPSDIHKGAITCSMTKEGILSICLWEDTKKKGWFKRVRHIAMGMDGIIPLKGFMDTVMQVITLKIAKKSEFG